ncbi:MAG: ADP-ribosylglycohydrolase family protein [Xenococcaceae cyanobacterium]
MRYSSIARFKGGLIGCELAEISSDMLAIELTSKSQRQENWQSQIQSRYLEDDRIFLSTTLQLRNIIVAKLIDKGKLNARDWQTIGDRYQQLTSAKERLDTGIVASITFPLALYYHENFESLEEQLTMAIESWQDIKAYIALKDLMLWYEAIALALRERLAPNPLPQLIERSQAIGSNLTKILEQLQASLAEANSLEQIIATLGQPVEKSRLAIPLALYCFAATPEDFNLAVTRARRLGDCLGTTAALTGALAGVYNSISGIPLTWILTCDRDVERQATKLFASWAGIASDRANSSLDIEAIAATSLIQPRSSLKIISQK